MKSFYYSCLLLTLTLINSNFSAQTTFSDIADVLYRNCTDCHRPGGGAPFSMLTYSDTYPWYHAMEHALLDGDMPPWGADTSYMHFVNERPITQSDMDAILDWIDDGALEGNPANLPPAPTYPQYLLNGTPDLILQMPPFASNADTADAYNTVVIPTGLQQARYIRAIEIVPVDPELTHHIVINADSAGHVVNDFTGISFDVEGDIAIGGYQPGSNPIVFPNAPQLKMGIEIPANGDLILQIHTPQNTLGQMVDLQVRMYLYPPGETGIRPVYTFVPLEYWGSDFWFAPEEIKTISTEHNPSSYIPVDISIYSALPHSHQICTEVLNYAYDGADTIPLIYINRWDFEHQVYYYYQNLVRVPVGYTYHADHKYENTSDNHHNPFDPPQIITVGTNSTDEMLFDAFQFIVYQAGDENINVDSILTNDPLLNYPTVGVEESLARTRFKPSYSVPNPMSEVTNIYFVHPHQQWEKYQLRLWNIEGKRVRASYSVKEGFIQLNRGNLNNGVLFYEILNDGDILSSGKVVVSN